MLLWGKERNEYALFESLFARMKRAYSEYALTTELIHEWVRAHLFVAFLHGYLSNSIKYALFSYEHALLNTLFSEGLGNINNIIREGGVKPAVVKNGWKKPERAKKKRTLEKAIRLHLALRPSHPTWDAGPRHPRWRSRAVNWVISSRSKSNIVWWI